MGTLDDYVLNQLVPTIIKQHQMTKPVVIGITGNVASGKTTLAKQIQSTCEKQFPTLKTYLVSTDNFLLTNRQLRLRHLVDRKGFPESYDNSLIHRFVSAVGEGQDVSIPEYDHSIDNINRRRRILVHQPDVILIEGLMTLQPIFRQLLSESFFLTVDEKDNFDWFMSRCFKLNLPALYHLSMPDFTKLATHNWQTINLVNFHENVQPYANTATVQLKLAANHEVKLLTLRHELRTASDQLIKQRL